MYPVDYQGGINRIITPHFRAAVNEKSDLVTLIVVDFSVLTKYNMMEQLLLPLKDLDHPIPVTY